MKHKLEDPQLLKQNCRIVEIYRCCIKEMVLQSRIVGNDCENRAIRSYITIQQNRSVVHLQGKLIDFVRRLL